MSADQAARAEKNRLKAVALKKARLMSKDIAAPAHITGEKQSESLAVKKPVEVVDTGAGFFIDEEDEELAEATQTKEKPAPIIEPDR